MAIVVNRYDDGTIVIRSSEELGKFSYRITDYLTHWASARSNKVFIGERRGQGWRSLTYSETYNRVRSIAQSLLNRDLSGSNPVVILSENSVDHALLALACLHVGIPFSAVSPAYSLRSLDYDKLKHVFSLLTPGLIFVSDRTEYAKALNAVAGEIEVVSSFDEFLKVTPTEEVDKAHEAIQPGSTAKILFTSGSTGLPKGVINTHENLTANLQQITQTFPFLRDEDLELVDWLPWNHTFGGNHNFGIALFNGGSLYIDNGNPTPDGILQTVRNLRERRPTTYFNVPRGFEMLVPVLRKDDELRKQFFGNLKMLFYAGAGMAQHVWDALEQLSLETTGNKILIGTGLGCTESCPSALFASKPGGFSGLLGVPVPGLELKLVPREGKMEARYRGKNVFPGYWRQPELTVKVFDEEGFYCTGDALLFADESDPSRGMLFNGRIAEDFKLSTGTWVSVGVLKAQLIAEGNGLIQDAVITGHDRDFVGAIIFPRSDGRLTSDDVREVLLRLGKKSTGSSTFIRKAVIAEFTLSLDRGEITDKGSINQRAIINNHPEMIDRLYSINHQTIDIGERP